MAAPKLPLHPSHPERVCWGCDRYCPADDMVCGNGTIRCPHPRELFGADWLTAFEPAPQAATEDEAARRPGSTPAPSHQTPSREAP